MRARSHRYQDEKDEYIDMTHFDTKTKNLDIGYQRLKIFNHKLYPNTSQIKSLFIDHNNLTQLPSPSLLPSLTELNCSNNKLTNIPFYPNLEFLNASDNKISTLNTYNNSNLTYLDCSFNSNTLFNMTLNNCKHLYINDTTLRTIDLTLLPIIEFLDCSNNKLDKIGQSNTLIELNIQYNNISELPQLPNLRVLMGDNNSLTHLITYPKLENLTIAHNKLTKIDSQPILKKIVATHNNICAIGSMPCLELIDIGHNKLQTIDIPETIKFISIQFNPLIELNMPTKMDILNEMQVDFETYKKIYDKYYDNFKSIGIRVSTDKISEKLQSMCHIFDVKTTEYIKSMYLGTRFQNRDEMLFKVSFKLYCKYFGRDKNEIVSLVKSNEFLFLLKNMSNLYYKTIIVTLFFNL